MVFLCYVVVDPHSPARIDLPRRFSEGLSKIILYNNISLFICVMFALRPAKALKIFPLCLLVFHSPCIASSQFSKGCNEKGLLKFLVLFCIDMEFSLSRWQGTRVDILPFTWQDSSNPWGFGPINRRSNTL